MVRGLYTAASGMLAQQVHIDIIANNLANVNTPGYRADRMLTRAFPHHLIYRADDAPFKNPVPIGPLGTGAYVDGTALSLEQGALQRTGNPLHVAIVGDGFFAVETAAGLRLTRDGGFTIDGEGWLVTASGARVLGQQGAIRLGDGTRPPSRVSIDESGGVWVDGQRVDTLLVVAVDNPAWLQKEGANLMVPSDASGEPYPLPQFRLQEGHREGSNVQVVTEMVRIITAHRAYEVAQRAVQAHDQLLDRAVNEVARL